MDNEDGLGRETLSCWLLENPSVMYLEIIRVYSRSFVVSQCLPSTYESAFKIHQFASLLQGAFGEDAVFEGDSAGVCGQDAERNG